MGRPVRPCRLDCLAMGRAVQGAVSLTQQKGTLMQGADPLYLTGQLAEIDEFIADLERLLSVQRKRRELVAEELATASDNHAAEWEAHQQWEAEYKDGYTTQSFEEWMTEPASDMGVAEVAE